MIEKKENKYAGNVSAAGSPERNRQDGKTVIYSRNVMRNMAIKFSQRF
jgi:hypothetical protein